MNSSLVPIHLYNRDRAASKTFYRKIYLRHFPVHSVKGHPLYFKAINV